MIKALFLDVDGTLVSFATHRVPESAREALQRAHERGVRIIIATGRAAADLEPLEGIPYDSVAALNGAWCVERDGTVVSRMLIPQQEFERSLALAAEYDFPVALEMDEGTFVDRVTPLVAELSRRVAHPVPEAVDLRALFARSACAQMCFYVDRASEARVMERLPSLQANRWCDEFADINVRGADKASGIEAFMKHYGWKREEVMAIGDGGNDLPMLHAAGIGVAMGNACAEAKAIADYVTTHLDEDGIRHALEYYKVIE